MKIKKEDLEKEVERLKKCYAFMEKMCEDKRIEGIKLYMELNHIKNKKIYKILNFFGVWK